MTPFLGAFFGGACFSHASPCQSERSSDSSSLSKTLRNRPCFLSQLTLAVPPGQSLCVQPAPSMAPATLPFFRGLEHVVPNTTHAALRARVAHHSSHARARRRRHARNLGHAGGAPPRHPAQYAAHQSGAGRRLMVGGRRLRTASSAP